MKKSKLIKCSLAVALVFGSVSTLVGCGGDDSDNMSSDKQYSIYQMAVDAGYSGTYEEWLIAINGNKGADGATWLAGVSSPSNDVGKNGDFYFNTSTKTIYNKINNVWSMVASVNDGNGIVSVNKSSENNVDTYTIIYNDGSSYTFSVSNAKEVEFRVNEGNVQWSYKNTNNWINLVSLDSLKGNEGRAPIIDLIDGVIVWKYDGDANWQTLLDLSSIKGEDGTKWEIGDGVPSSNGKIGDFYFDKLNNDVYLWTEYGWTFQLSLDKEDEKETFYLNNGVYKGFFDSDHEFEMIILNDRISSFKINGVSSNNNFNSYYKIVDNNKIKLSAKVRGEGGYTTFEYFYTLRESNRLIKNYDNDDFELLRGVYYSDRGAPLTLSSNKFAYLYNGISYVGYWEVIEKNGNDWLILLDGGNEKLFVTVSYIDRNYSFNSIECDYFSKTYNLNGEVIELLNDKGSSYIVKEDGVAVEVNLYNLSDTNERLYVESVDGDLSLVLDYFSGSAVVADLGNYSMVGKTIEFILNQVSYSYYFDSLETKWNLLENSFSYAFDEYVVNINVVTGQIDIHYKNSNAYLLSFKFDDIVWNTENNGFYENGNYKMDLELNEDSSIKNILVESIEYVECYDEESLREAIVEGEEFIKLVNDIHVNKAIYISGGKYTIDLNGYIIDSNVDYLNDAIIRVEDYDDGIDSEIFVKVKNGYVGNFVRMGEEIVVKRTDAPEENISKQGFVVNGGANTVVVLDGVNISGYETGFATVGLPEYCGANITISDSFVYSSMNDPKDGAGAYLAGYADYNFTNVYFAGSSGVYVKSGEVSLIDCEVVATGDKVDPIYGGNGYWPTGSSLVVDSAYGYVRPLNVTIIGGSYISVNNYSIEQLATSPSGVDNEAKSSINGIESAVLKGDVSLLSE